MFKISIRKHVFCLLVLAAAGCGDAGPRGESGPPGDTGAPGEAAALSLVETRSVAPGAECANGGTQIVSGVDADQNGELSDDEIAAGSTTLVCAPAAECDETLTITDITGTDQTFVDGVESSPMTVQLSSTSDVELSFVAPDLEFKPGANPGEFTVVPHAVGGPFQVAVMATDGCSFDVTNFAIDEVQPMVTLLGPSAPAPPRQMAATERMKPGVTI